MKLQVVIQKLSNSAEEPAHSKCGVQAQLTAHILIPTLLTAHILRQIAVKFSMQHSANADHWLFNLHGPASCNLLC